MNRVANYWFPGCFTRPTGDLDSQLSPRVVHVEACRPREICTCKVSFGTSVRPPELRADGHRIRLHARGFLRAAARPRDGERDERRADQYDRRDGERLLI